jgi:hypothetical protein
MVNLKENTDAHIETHCASIFHGFSTVDTLLPAS